MGTQSADNTTSPAETGQTVQSAPDERDERIRRLERTLDEERRTLAELRETLESTRFKAEILEKSYAKQLADARERIASLEKTVAEEQRKSAALSSDLESASGELKNARSEVEYFSEDKGVPRHPAVRARSGAARRHENHISSGNTINALISTDGWEDEATGSGPSRRVLDQVAAPQESSEDMLSPDLVFTSKDRD